MLRKRIFLPLLSLLLSTPQLASAQDALQVELKPTALQGQGLPQLVVHAERTLSSLKLSLTRSSDGKQLTLKKGKLRGGRAHAFELPMKVPGTTQFEGSLSVVIAGGQTANMPLKFEAKLLAPIKLSMVPGGLDQAKKLLRFTANRSLKTVEVTLMSDLGTPLVSISVAAQIDTDDNYLVNYQQEPGTVMRISIKGIDHDGYFGGMELFPWRVDIPHEEVMFASGSANVAKSEMNKLSDSYKLLQGAIRKYGKLAKIKLYIAGHTDTVGPAASNRELSRRRARSIGLWFKKRGVKIPILFAGFGEDIPLKQTADEVDEPLNRRAEYIVAVDAPAIRGKEVRFRPL